MQPNITSIIKQSIRYWWLYLLTGLCLIVVGVWIFLSPEASYLSLSLLFATAIFVTGILEIIFALTVNKSLKGWGWTLAGGIFDLIIGVYLIMYPAITMQILPFILGFWLLFRGISAIGSAFELKSYHSPNWVTLLILGLLICFFAIMVLAVPAFGVLNIIMWTSLAFIAAGVFRIFFAFRLRRLNNAK